MLHLYHNSLHVRLPEFQKKYLLGFKVMMVTLILSSLSILLYQAMFDITKNTKRFYSNSVYAPYILAEALKADDIHCYDGTDERERYQLQYYDISTCSD